MMHVHYPMDTNPIDIPEELIVRLKSARRVAVLTGAGVSAESGVPTFRDAQTGLWERYRPEDLASPEAFLRDPRLVWKWYAWRRALVAKAQPNPGHIALVEFEERIPGFNLITQNVDGLHQRAGSGRRTPVIELHGNIQRSKCSKENRQVESWQEDEEVPPRCPACGAWLRPDVVWFGEPLPQNAWQAAYQAAENSEIFFSVGTSALVEPAAYLPFVALQGGSCLVEINPQWTPLSPEAAFVLNGPSGQVLPALARRVWG
jgi:NAD-dependent deacetylase